MVVFPVRMEIDNNVHSQLLDDRKALSIVKELGMDIIIDLHPDGEYDHSAIPQAISEIKNGADFVLGNRFTTITQPLESGMYFWKLIPILFLNTVARLI